MRVLGQNHSNTLRSRNLKKSRSNLTYLQLLPPRMATALLMEEEGVMQSALASRGRSKGWYSMLKVKTRNGATRLWMLFQVTTRSSESGTSKAGTSKRGIWVMGVHKCRHLEEIGSLVPQNVVYPPFLARQMWFELGCGLVIPACSDGSSAGNRAMEQSSARVQYTFYV